MPADVLNSLGTQPGGEAEQRAGNGCRDAEFEYRKPRGLGIDAKSNDQSDHGTNGSAKNGAYEHESWQPRGASKLSQQCSPDTLA
jgi:hypothetical protein